MKEIIRAVGGLAALLLGGARGRAVGAAADLVAGLVPELAPAPPPAAPPPPVPAPAAYSPANPRPRRTCAAAVELVRDAEGLHDGDPSTPALEPAMCPKGLWTVGWGHVLVVRGRQLQGEADRAAALAEWRRRWPGGLTLVEADALLDADLAVYERGVARLCPVRLTDNQFGALVSLTYNIGLGAEGGPVDFADSTLRRKLLAGDYPGAAAEFPKWNKVRKGGELRVVPGLTRRRLAEQRLFLTP